MKVFVLYQYIDNFDNQWDELLAVHATKKGAEENRKVLQLMNQTIEFKIEEIEVQE